MLRKATRILTVASLVSRSAPFFIRKASSARTTLRIQVSQCQNSFPVDPRLALQNVDDDEDLLMPAARYQSDPNDQRYSASDWYHNIKTMPNSSILREIKNPILAVTIWSTLVSVVHHIFSIKGWTSIAQSMCMSSKPHSLLVSALGLLLVFRTNSAYQRFTEGRLIWEKVLATARNMSRMVALYEVDMGTERKHRIFRLLAAFPYLLRHHIQPQFLEHDNCALQKGTTHAIVLQVPGNPTCADRLDVEGTTDIFQECWVDRRSLPWCLFPTQALQACAASNNRPLWVCDRLSHEVTSVDYTPNFTSRERMTFIKHVDKLSVAVGECERIHQTVVPLNYARHSLRSLTIWLFTLPFSMLAEMKLLTGPVMGVLSWLLLGVYQIGYTIEDPFQGSLRLSILCDAIYRDVMYNGKALKNQRETAFSMVKEEVDEWVAVEGAEQKTSLKTMLP